MDVDQSGGAKICSVPLALIALYLDLVIKQVQAGGGSIILVVDQFGSLNSILEKE